MRSDRPRIEQLTHCSAASIEILKPSTPPTPLHHNEQDFGLCRYEHWGYFTRYIVQVL